MLIKNLLLDNNKAVIRTTAEKLGESMVPNTSYYVFTVLAVLTLLSLWGTYYSYSNPIHKVLALLLVSILTVMLWMWETPFLFIYIVYILAFIGAVLMLFLSVVLMLPISSIHYRNSPLLLLTTTTLVPSDPLLKPPFFDETVGSCWAMPEAAEVLEPWFVMYIVVIISVYAWMFKVVVAKGVWQSRDKDKFKLEFGNVVECAMQLIWFACTVFCAVPVSLVTDSAPLSRTPDTQGGLENIKSLLYENFSPFLIISTMVLLVALIGAAIMTRNKK